MNLIVFILLFNYLRLIICLDEDNRPEIQDLLISSKLIEGKKFYLTCQLNSGQLPITFKWYHSGELVKSNSNLEIVNNKEISHLTIKQMNSNFNGEWLCKAENVYGSDTKKIDVKLNVKPKWINELTDIAIKLNSELNIDCLSSVSGYPLPKVKLERLLNGNVIETYETGKLKTKFTKNYVSKYRCSAENLIGSISKEFQVKSLGNV